jgi:hypothetical protein
VQAVLTSFPGAEIVGVRLREDLAAPQPSADPDAFDESNPPPIDDDDIEDQL